MGPIHRVLYTTPDGVERTLRWTYGAEAEAARRFGFDLSAAMDKDSAALPAMVYLAMYDEEGEPPADLTEKRFLNTLPPDAVPELVAVWLEAKTQGKKKAAEILPDVQKQFDKMTNRLNLAIPKTSPSSSGQPRTKSSASRKKSSGGASPAPK